MTLSSHLHLMSRFRSIESQLHSLCAFFASTWMTLLLFYVSIISLLLFVMCCVLLYLSFENFNMYHLSLLQWFYLLIYLLLTWQENEEDCIMMSFMNFSPHQIFLGWSGEEGWGGCYLWHVLERRKHRLKGESRLRRRRRWWSNSIQVESKAEAHMLLTACIWHTVGPRDGNCWTQIIKPLSA